MSTFKAGLIGIVVIVVASYLAYTKFANPFASKYTVHAIFTNANGLRPQSSLVRIAGINVGKVTSVEPVSSCQVDGKTQTACNDANVTMEISDQGLPIHKDATFSIRPRIFLEGNFFLDVNPGTPEAPVAPNGWTFPPQQGIEPVQFDQVLGALPSDTRRNLQILLQQYGTAVKVGGPSYNASIQYWLPAYKYSSQVAHDFLGYQPHDLSGFIDKQGQVSGAFDTHPQNLKSLITDFNTTALAFARENNALAQTLAELPGVLSQAMPTFHALNAAFCSGSPIPNCAPGPLPQLAHALLPGVKSTPAMVDASLPFITQLRLLVQPSELQGLAKDLAPTIPALAKLNQETIPLMKNGVRPAASCNANVIFPWSQLTLKDPNFNSSNGFPPRKVYVEAVDFLPGLAGESRDFDANGPYIRILLTGGSFTYSLSPPGAPQLFGTSIEKITGVQPQLPPGGRRPPLQENTPCETQPVIRDLSTPTGGPAPQMSTPLATPDARARQQSEARTAVPLIAQIAKQAGLKFNLVTALPKGK